MDIEKLLGKIYNDPKEGFMGENNLFKKKLEIYQTVKFAEEGLQ